MFFFPQTCPTDSPESSTPHERAAEQFEVTIRNSSQTTASADRSRRPSRNGTCINHSLTPPVVSIRGLASSGGGHDNFQSLLFRSCHSRGIGLRPKHGPSRRFRLLANADRHLDRLLIRSWWRRKSPQYRFELNGVAHRWCWMRTQHGWVQPSGWSCGKLIRTTIRVSATLPAQAASSLYKEHTTIRFAP